MEQQTSPTPVKAHDDVLLFLQDLDSLEMDSNPTKATKAASAMPVVHTAMATKSSVDVLTFLNELEQEPSLENKLDQPMPSGQVAIPASKKTTRAPAITNNQKPSVSNPLANKSNQEAFTGIQKQDEINSQTSNWGGWGVLSSNLWSQAQAVTSLTTASLSKGLEHAKQMAEETVAKTDTIISSVNAEDITKLGVNITKLGSDFTKITANLVDTFGNSSGIQRSNEGLCYENVIVWYCIQDKLEDLYIHDTIIEKLNELWVLGNTPLCKKVDMNDVVDSAPRFCDSFDDATNNIHRVQQKMELLMGSQSKPDECNTASMYLIIQPFKVDMLGLKHVSKRERVQYIVSLFAPESSATAQKKRGVAAFSQTFGLLEEEESNMKLKKLFADQKRFLLENAIHDVLFEFALECFE